MNVLECLCEFCIPTYLVLPIYTWRSEWPIFLLVEFNLLELESEDSTEDSSSDSEPEVPPGDDENPENSNATATESTGYFVINDDDLLQGGK